MSPFLSFHLILTWVEKHSRVGVQQSINGEVSSSISFVTRLTLLDLHTLHSYLYCELTYLQYYCECSSRELY